LLQKWRSAPPYWHLYSSGRTTFRSRRCAQHKMRSVVTDVEWSVSVSVCLLVTTVSCAETDKTVEMRSGFGLETGGPTNHVLDGGSDPPRKGVLLGSHTYSSLLVGHGQTRQQSMFFSTLFARGRKRRGLLLLVYSIATCLRLLITGRSLPYPLSSDRQHLSYGGCLEVKGEYCQNCSVLCCVQQLCTTVCTEM